MTGLILAGAAPLHAVLAQTVVMFLVLAATATVVIALVLIRRLFTPDHRLVYLPFPRRPLKPSVADRTGGCQVGRSAAAPRPASRALMIAWARSATWSLLKMFETWLRTVSG